MTGRLDAGSRPRLASSRRRFSVVGPRGETHVRAIHGFVSQPSEAGMRTAHLQGRKALLRTGLVVEAWRSASTGVASRVLFLRNDFVPRESVFRRIAL